MIHKMLIKRLPCFAIFLSIFSLASAQESNYTKHTARKYYGPENFLIEGTAFADSLKESPFDRLPLIYKSKLSDDIWKLSKESAGISIRFFTNSTSIKIRWNLLHNGRYNINMPVIDNMAATGVHGIDLYCRVNGRWQYVNTARPEGRLNDFILIENMKPQMREFKMYLPLYDCVTRLHIGIDSLSVMQKPRPQKQKPVVFYGTSITQGSAASRPGMAYLNILSRRMDADIVNFGFSSYGKMDTAIGRIMATIDASFYVIDGTANVTDDEISDNLEPLVLMLRNQRPSTPIVFVEGLMTEKAAFDDSTRKIINEKNQMLYHQYQKMVSLGTANLYYIPAKEISGPDHEGTVDGVHLTDLGAMRFAEAMEKCLKHLHLKIIETGKK
jgi:hypothetical protein